MAKKVWELKLDDGNHVVQLEHGWFSGKRKIIVDGVTLESSTKFFDRGSVHQFQVSGVPCVLRIKNEAFTFKYELYVNRELEETKATGPEGRAADIKGDLRSWGLGLIVIGVIHFVLSGFLDPVWGGILIAIGISCLFIIQRGMYIVIGTALILAGIMNILVGGFGGWAMFGFFQIGCGMYQIHKFREYGRISGG